ncbi:unnamed protein product, partial [Plutella xylostella]
MSLQVEDVVDGSGQVDGAHLVPAELPEPQRVLVVRVQGRVVSGVVVPARVADPHVVAFLGEGVG